jgi:ubiquinone/menaquinone biosynthesis C-methylase UbiE
MPSDTLSKAWEEQAERWVKWAREPGHDSYWQFHRDQFFELLPSPGQLTVDVGCGEGRLPRDLKARGHKVIGIDASPTLIKYARQADPTGEYHEANAAAIPLANECCDLVIAFMSLQDVDDLPKATAEISRILKAGGRACVAIVHPLNSAGRFSDDTAESPFVIAGAYLSEMEYSDTFERDGLEMTFHSKHRTVDAYSRSFEAGGLLMEAIREHAIPQAQAEQSQRKRQWQRLPLFMHFRLLKPLK